MTRHPALRAIAPRFTDFSKYRHAVHPVGVCNAVVAVTRPSLVQAVDRNDACGALMGVTKIRV